MLKEEEKLRRRRDEERRVEQGQEGKALLEGKLRFRLMCPPSLIHFRGFLESQSPLHSSATHKRDKITSTSTQHWKIQTERKHPQHGLLPPNHSPKVKNHGSCSTTNVGSRSKVSLSTLRCSSLFPATLLYLNISLPKFSWPQASPPQSFTLQVFIAPTVMNCGSRRKTCVSHPHTAIHALMTYIQAFNLLE